MALYDELSMIDVVGPTIGKYNIRYTRDGRPAIVLEAGYKESPWISHRVHLDRSCGLWHIYFSLYGIIPRGCRSCWKVVMGIKTLKELFRIKELQQDSPYNCKCGLETRPMTGGLGGYRAFWYGRIKQGLAGGREMYKYLRKQFPGVKLILKRGCTEFEAVHHPSDTWDELADKGNWDMREELANTLFMVQKPNTGGTPNIIQPSIVKRWIEWAYEHHKTTGDDSCFDYLEGRPFPGYMTYESSIHNEKDFIGSTFEPIEAEGYADYEQNYTTERSKDSANEVEDRSVSGEIVQFEDLEKEKSRSDGS
jgi:hypothetical protein